MPSNLIFKLYAKIVLACICTVVLAVVVIFTMDVSLLFVLLFAGIVLGYYGYTGWSIHKLVQEGEIVVIYAACVSKEPAKTILGKEDRKRYSYRFLAQNGEDDREGDATEMLPASMYVCADKGTFVVDEAYCMLFRRSDGEYSEKNLLAHEIVKSAPVVLDTNKSEEEKNDAKEKLIYFVREDTNE